MIRKYLVVGKRSFMTSQKKFEGAELLAEGIGSMLELSMPVDAFWKADACFKEADYQMSCGTDPLKITELYREVYAFLVPYVVTERERIWLREKAGIAVANTSPPPVQTSTTPA